jgi:hypothetical protein
MRWRWTSASEQTMQDLGMALIASGFRQLSIVNIAGSPALDKAHRLAGHFGAPMLDTDPAASAPAQR